MRLPGVLSSVRFNAPLVDARSVDRNFVSVGVVLSNRVFARARMPAFGVFVATTLSGSSVAGILLGFDNLLEGVHIVQPSR
jgi:hypothetical protein